MFINFPSRSLARSFAAKRSASGLPSKVVDNGKDAVKRYCVNVSKKQQG